MLLGTSGTPAPCFCLQIDFDSSNADQFIGTYDFYLYNISRYALYKPFLLYPGGRVSGCPMSFQCPEGEVQILTTSERSYEVRAVEMFCVDEMWTVIDGSDVTQLTRSVYMTCAYFSTPSTKNLPPLETMCNCPHKMMPNYLIPDNRILEPNFFITSTISNDRCVWEIQCGYPTNLKFNANGQEFSGSWSIGICDKSTNKWDIFYQKRLTNYTLNAMPNFDFMCDYN
ncbi:hypothetical protein L3Y34_016399 [Caenorhabditis briggsae]|uniref:Uncharacterized protein n=1 Tax=Caenorhabditis briggsae TaxID=6238 RepID=A0AAE9J113_CAEBR|nr:hypothetical protein L3Y34_016399 [Caenorhabditis briggsae]